MARMLSNTYLVLAPEILNSRAAGVVLVESRIELVLKIVALLFLTLYYPWVLGTTLV